MPDIVDSVNESITPRLSKLDYFAAMALQGFLSHEGTRGMSHALAQKAFELARHMVEESKRVQEKS